MLQRAASKFFHSMPGKEFWACRHSTKIFSLKRTPRQRWRPHQSFLVRAFGTLSDASNGYPISMFDSLSESIQPLPSIEGKGLAWYTCGPTTYAPAHLGHARTYVCIDIVRRVLEAQARVHEKVPPLFVMNITDVDDKIIAAASEQQVSPIDLARKFEAEFWKDLDALNCLRPHVVTRVTESIEPHIVPYIERLVAKGMAYETEDGVYFDVRAYNERLGKMTRYGKLAPAAAAQDLEVTRRDDSSGVSRKKDSRDFVLWKLKKADESLSWPSPWGDGRPGWHIECSAMIEAVQKQFQLTHRFLVHAGGVDLKFPHHTNEIAQSEAYRQVGDWIPHWVHTGHLHIDGLKMSKSLKNFISIQDFLAEYNTGSTLESPSDDFRLWCLSLSGSYRGAATFSKERLAEARAIRQQILRFLMEGQSWVYRMEGEPQESSKVWGDADHRFWLECHEAHRLTLQALNHDVDGAEFLKHCLRIVSAGKQYMSTRDRGPMECMNAVLSNFRETLSMVGFTMRTTGAGLSRGNDASFEAMSEVVGGERVVLDILTKFRSAVRHSALEDASAGEATENMKRVLDLCDDIRDVELPKIGVELIDDKVDGGGDGWRMCLPKTEEDKLSETSKKPRASNRSDLSNVALQDLFRVGQYEGLFSQYTADGIPTHNADGSEISKRALKKLLKKREAHKERIRQ